MSGATKPVWFYDADRGVLVGTFCGCMRCTATRARAASAELARIANRARMARPSLARKVLSWVW